MKTVVSLLNGSKHHGIQFPPELLQCMDSLYAFYHQQWWCYRKMLNHYKCINALFNGMALLLMAARMIATAFGKQYVGSMFGGGGDGGQRME